MDRPVASASSVPGSACGSWCHAGSSILIGLGLAARRLATSPAPATPVPTTRATRRLVTTGIHGWTRNPSHRIVSRLRRHRRRRAQPWILSSCCPLPSRSATACRGARGSVSGTALRRAYRDYKARCLGRRLRCEIWACVVLGALMVVLASLARGCPTPDEANNAVPDASSVREVGMGRGHCSHLGRRGVASPADCGDRGARHHLRDTARRSAGQRRSDNRRSSRLRADAYHGAAIHATRRSAVISGKMERCLNRRCVGDHPHAQSPLQRPGGRWSFSPDSPACR